MSCKAAETSALGRQGWIGLTLAASIILSWSILHIYALFIYTPLHWLSDLVLIICITWLSVGLFIVAHDAMHGSLFPQQTSVGDAIGTVSLLLYAGFTYQHVLPKHHLHHKYPGSEDDPDFAPESPDEVLRWYLRFTRTYFGLREHIIMGIRVALYWIAGASLGNILLFFALPGIMSSFQLFYFGTFLPHRHEKGVSRTRFPDRHNTRSIHYGYLLSLLTCFHFGYHHEHHLKPEVPWWGLPSVRRERQAQFTLRAL